MQYYMDLPPYKSPYLSEWNTNNKILTNLCERIGWKPVKESTVKHCFHLSALPYTDDQTWGINNVDLRKLYLSEEKPPQKLILLI